MCAKVTMAQLHPYYEAGAVPGRVAVGGRFRAMPELKGREKTDCWGMVPHWDGESDEETTATNDLRDTVGRQLLLCPGLISGFEGRLLVDNEEDVRSVTPSSTNNSPEARKDWLGCGWSVDRDEDEVVVDGAVEDVGLAVVTKGWWNGSNELLVRGGGGRRATLAVNVDGTNNMGFFSFAECERFFFERTNARSSLGISSKALERKIVFGLISLNFWHVGPDRVSHVNNSSLDQLGIQYTGERGKGGWWFVNVQYMDENL
ncbi:hypothetical protein F5888DRAFT_1633505 [Russula emetica]|nr:hypothetical protein F5888DRAFT_1633505 [Russula emetica]